MGIHILAPPSRIMLCTDECNQKILWLQRGCLDANLTILISRLQMDTDVLELMRLMSKVTIVTPPVMTCIYMAQSRSSSSNADDLVI